MLPSLSFFFFHHPPPPFQLHADIADLKAGHAAQLERANTPNGTPQSAIFDSSANTDGIVVLTGTNEGLVGKLATTTTVRSVARMHLRLRLCLHLHLLNECAYTRAPKPTQ